MYKHQKILGLIPARGGSKGLPGKNILPLAGKPVIAWTIQEALKSRYLDKVIVSTDDLRIAKVAKRYGAEVPFLRPKILATDKAKSIDVVFHAVETLGQQGITFDYVALLEPTSPLREAKDIDKAIEILVNNRKGALSIVGVSRVEAAHPAFDTKISRSGFLRPYQGRFANALRRQDVDDVGFSEGSIYVSKVNALYKKKGFYHDKTIPYVVPRWKSLELDNRLDLICMEAILRNKNKFVKEESHE